MKKIIPFRYITMPRRRGRQRELVEIASPGLDTSPHLHLRAVQVSATLDHQQLAMKL